MVRTQPSPCDPDTLAAFATLQEEFRIMALRFADFAEERQVLKDAGN